MPDYPSFPAPLVDASYPDPGGFGCALRHSGRDAAWVGVSGKLDLASAPQLDQCLDRALLGALLLVVDLSQLTFIDGAGVHVIVRAHDRASRTGRRLVLIRGHARIDRLLDLAGMSKLLEVADLNPIHAAPASVALPSADAA